MLMFQLVQLIFRRIKITTSVIPTTILVLFVHKVAKNWRFPCDAAELCCVCFCAKTEFFLKSYNI